MDAQPSDARVHLRLKCSDAEDFVARFAPNVTRGGIFLPTHEARDVGASIRFEVAIADDTVVLAGDGVVTWAKAKGMGVKFTTLDPTSEPMLERLLSRREAAAPAPARPSPVGEPASPAQTLPRESSVETRWWRPTPAALETTPTPPAVPVTEMTGVSTRSFAQSTRRPLVRVAVACAGVFVGIGVVWLSVGRARIDTGSSREPVKPAAAEIAPAPVTMPAAEIGVPPVENTAPPAASGSQEPAAAPPAPAPEPPAEMPPAPAAEKSAASERAPGARSGSVRVEKLLAGTAYKNFTCPNPATRFSAKSTRTVNVCLQVAHKPGKTEHVTLVWERNGGFSGKTSVAVPSSKSTVRTRARIRIGASRVGSWSVRAVSDRNASLAETTFEVVP